MKITDNRVNKRAEPYLSREEKLSFIQADKKKREETPVQEGSQKG
jgi:hypothetical protein